MLVATPLGDASREGSLEPTVLDMADRQQRDCKS